MKNFSRNLNDEAVSELHDLLDTVMTSSVTSQIQVVNSTMSQCCCLILKVLISQQSDNSQFGKCDLDKLKVFFLLIGCNYYDIDYFYKVLQNTFKKVVLSTSVFLVILLRLNMFFF